MSATTRPVPITVEQYEQFEGYPGLRDELINGKIVMSPHAKPLHQLIAKSLERELDRLVENTPYYVNRDTNFKFAELHSMPAPDVFVVRRDVFLEACRMETYMSDPPLLAVEVLSPANRRLKVVEKVEIYLRAGVSAVWVVDPKRQSVRVATKDGESTYRHGDSISLEPPLTGSIAVAGVFRLK